MQGHIGKIYIVDAFNRKLIIDPPQDKLKEYIEIAFNSLYCIPCSNLDREVKGLNNLGFTVNSVPPSTVYNCYEIKLGAGVDLDRVLGAPSGELSVKGGGRPRATGARVKNGCSRSYCRSRVSDCKSLDRTVLVEWFTS